MRRSLLLLLLVVLVVGLRAPCMAAQPSLSAESGYQPGDPIPMSMTRLMSSRTLLPFQFYDLPFCPPVAGAVLRSRHHETLGEVLLGRRMDPSPYPNITAMTDVVCAVACTVAYPDHHMDLFTSFLQDEYRVEMTLDSLPAVIPRKNKDGVDAGIPLGFQGYGEGSTKERVPYLNNHLTIRIQYRRRQQQESSASGGGIDILGWSAHPASVASQQCPPIGDPSPSSTPAPPVDPQPLVYGETITWTYSVQWQENPGSQSSRYEAYMHTGNTRVHWFSLTTSAFVMCFMAGSLFFLLKRALREVSLDEAEQLLSLPEPGLPVQSSTWKSVAKDVFRPPWRPEYFSVLIGSSLQVLLVVVTLVVFSLSGILSLENRSNILSTMMFLFLCYGAVAGYVAVRWLKTFGGEDWRRVIVLTTTAFPALCCIILLFAELIIWSKGSSRHVSFGTLLLSLLLGFLLHGASVYFGARIGMKAEKITYPVKPRPVAYPIPPKPVHMHPVVTTLAFALLPFGAVFTELYYFMSTLWQTTVYHMIFFLGMTAIILAITSALASCFLCFVYLESGDYRWWWRSFVGVGSSALYVALYSVFYCVTSLRLTHFFSYILFLGYMSVLCLIFALVTGCIGFLSAYLFLRKMYSFRME